MDAYTLEVLSRAGDAIDLDTRYSPALADAVVEPRRHTVPGPRSFELPKGIFLAMAAAYVAFITEMALAFGAGGGMPLVLGICGVYLAMYLGTPAIFGRVRTGTPGFALDWHRLREGGLDTLGGRMSCGAVLGQVLIVPACVAFFGLAVLVIVLTV